MKCWKFWVRVVAVLMALLLVYVLFMAMRIYRFGNVDEREEADVDAIVVLGASAWGNVPSPVLAERVRHGIWLYENGYADVIIFTGGYCIGCEYSEAFVAREYALRQGVDIDDIFIEELSTNTEGNMYYVSKILEEEGLESAIIVSDPIHMSRAMLVAKRHGIDAYSSPTPTTKYETFDTQLPFLMREVIFYTGYRVMSFFGIR